MEGRQNIKVKHKKRYDTLRPGYKDTERNLGIPHQIMWNLLTNHQCAGNKQDKQVLLREKHLVL